MSYKQKRPNMHISYGGESVQQHKKNLLNIDPIPKHASSDGPNKKQKSLQSYDSAYDKLSDEQKAEYRGEGGVEGEGKGREAFKKKAKKWNQTKYGTEQPSKDSSDAGITREDLAANKETKDKSKSFDGSGSNKKKGEDSTNKKVIATDADPSTRKGRKEMKKADKESGLSRKEVRSRKLQRKAAAADDADPKSKKAIKLAKKAAARKKRLDKNKK